MTKSKEYPNASSKVQVNLILCDKFHGPWSFQDIISFKKHQGVSYFKRILLWILLLSKDMFCNENKSSPSSKIVITVKNITD